MTSFAALVQEYLRAKRLVDPAAPAGRMIALLGDAEFDEGNVFEAMLETWKHDIRDVWWIIDYNRQSLDTIVTERLVQRMDAIFRDMEWNVVTLKYGRLLEQAFARRGGDALRDWIDACPNVDYSELAHAGGALWRSRLRRDLGGTSGIRELLDEHDDDRLQALMTNLGGHDLESVLDAFHGAQDGRPACFIAYTIKGYRLPFQGHKDNHAGLMSPEQVAIFRETLHIDEGEEWEPFAGLGIPEARAVVIHRGGRHLRSRRCDSTGRTGSRCPSGSRSPGPARRRPPRKGLADCSRTLRAITRRSPIASSRRRPT